MSTTPRAAKATKAPRAAAFGGFADATPPVAPPPAAAEPGTPPTTHPAPTATTAAPAAEQTAVTEPATMSPQPTPAGPAMSESPRDLARFLGDKGESDTGGGGFVRAMLAGPAIDPMQDLVQLNAAVPRHFKEALRLLAFASRRRERELVVEALANHIGPDLLDEALAAQQSRR